jgi:hypothetical protein
VHQVAHEVIVHHLGDVVGLGRVRHQIDINVNVQDQALRACAFKVVDADAGLNGQPTQKHAAAVAQTGVVWTHG